MRKALSLCFLFCFTASVLSAQSATKRSALQTYQGMCDASAAVALGGNLFAVASDEDSRLRIYDRDRGGLPLQTFDLSLPLGLNPRSPETDLEGAARVGDLVYWISSHGRNKDGEKRPNHSLFFATTTKIRDSRAEITVVGKPYRRLLQDLIAVPALQTFNLAAASKMPSKERGALNIEGLCATPENQLLIAFRSPTPGKRALLVPLLNPPDLVAGRPAKFGLPVLLSLGGLGIRDIALWDGRYLIVAGPASGSGNEKLFMWSGGAASPERIEHLRLKDLNPEAVVFYPDKGWSEFQLLSDDGGRRERGIECKDLKSAEDKRFRGVWVTP